MLLEVARPVAVSCAFSPCHITGFYHKILNHSSKLNSGSVGAGVSLADGVTTRVRIYDTVPNTSFDVSINGAMTESAIVSNKVLRDYIKLVNRPVHISVSHDTKIPIGFGLGTSGAAALSLSFSLNDALGTCLSTLECAQVAHCAELSCMTGLGTVISEFTGGLDLRTLAGAPGVGKVEKIPLYGMSVAAVCLSPVSTARCVNEQEHRLTIKAAKFLTQLLESRSINDFLKFSFEFSASLGIISGRCKSLIQLLKTNGFAGSVALFGKTVFTIVSDNEINSVLQLLKDYDRCCIVADVDNVGARLLKIA